MRPQDAPFLVLALVVLGCSSSEPAASSSDLRSEKGCDYEGCTTGNYDGVCPGDQPNLCYCKQGAGPTDCRVTGIIPSAPYSKAICCR